MTKSPMQQAFLIELAESFLATKARILRELTHAPGDAANILETELRGLYHGILVILDGGSGLADQGLIQIVDEDGVAFDRYLHEICLPTWYEVSAARADRV